MKNYCQFGLTFCCFVECLVGCLSADAKPLLVEAESFRDKGGWVVDPQFMDVMGSPFLLAHGLGKKAANQDIVPAMYYLGKLYAGEQAVTFDMEKAVYWWMHSRMLGDCESPGLVDFELSWCSVLDVGSAVFLERFEREYDYNYDPAEFLLRANSEMSEREYLVVDEDSWWYRYVQQEDDQALFWLGMCYNLVKQLVPPKGGDKKTCMMACFYKAAEMGNVFAQLYLAEKLYHFASSSRDQEEGIRWYRLAAEQGHPDAIVQMEKIESQGHIS